MSSFKLPETVTVWTPAGNDGFGGFTWARSEMKARTARRAERVKDEKGDVIDTKFIVYSRTLIQTGAFVKKGVVVDLTPPSDAIKVLMNADNETMTDMKVCRG